MYSLVSVAWFGLHWPLASVAELATMAYCWTVAEADPTLYSISGRALEPVLAT